LRLPTNASVREEIGPFMPLENRIRKQKLLYFGHVARANGLEKSTMLGMGEGSRGRGRPRMRWMDEILAMTNLPLAELMDATQDRVRWRRIVKDVTRGRLRLGGTR